MKAISTALAVVLVCLVASNQVQASRVDLCLLNDLEKPIDLWVDVSNINGNFEFEFHNDSLVAAAVTHVYFEAGLNDVLFSGGTKKSIDGTGGVNFSFFSDLTLPDVSAWGGDVMSADADVRQIDNGIMPGDTLTVTFKKRRGAGLAALVEKLLSNGRVAVLAQGTGDGLLSTISGWNGDGGTTGGVIPLPSAFPEPATIVGLAAVIPLALLRRRRTA